MANAPMIRDCELRVRRLAAELVAAGRTVGHSVPSSAVKGGGVLVKANRLLGEVDDDLGRVVRAVDSLADELDANATVAERYERDLAAYQSARVAHDAALVRYSTDLAAQQKGPSPGSVSVVARHPGGGPVEPVRPPFWSVS